MAESVILSSDALVWVDLETTGLDPDRDVILEVACIVTDSQLDEVVSYSRVTQSEPRSSGAFEALTRIMDDVVLRMHAENGLLEEIRMGSGVPLSVVQADICALLDEYIVDDGESKPVLAGSTVSFDRNFMEVHMPLVVPRLHYRNVDVSTIRELCERWRPELNRFRPRNEAKAHRALADIRESIEYLRFYREAWLS